MQSPSNTPDAATNPSPPSGARPLYIGLDLGTSYIKGGILDLGALTIRNIARRPFPAPPNDLPALHHEVEPQAVIAATRALLDELLAQMPACAGILISSQMHGFLLADDQGTPLTRLITWQDQRAISQIPAHGAPTPLAALESKLTPTDRQTLGNGFKASLPLCALYTMICQNQLPTHAVVWSLSDYVLTCLDTPNPTAERSVAEPTIAAAFGTYDFATHTWHTDLLDRLGLDKLHWPRLVPATEVVARYPGPHGPIPVYPGLGDHQCATLGSLLQPNELALNISTGSQVSLLNPGWTPSASYESRPYFDGRTLNTVTRVPAGRSLTALVQLLTELSRRQDLAVGDPWKTIVQAVDATPDTDLDVNLSFFAGTFGDAGHIGHIREENLTVGHLFRAAFHNMAENYAQCAQWLGWPPAGHDGESLPRRLVFAGGLAQNFSALRTIITQRLNARASRMSPHAEDTLLGLLAVALVIQGQAADLDAACHTLGETLGVSSV